MKIYLIGFMGCGKSHWGKQLSEKLKLPFFDLDEEIVKEENKTITEIFAKEGEEYFRHKEKDVLYTLTEKHHSFVLATGGGTPCFFNNIEYMNKNGTSVWFNCSVECLYSRLIKEKAQRPLIRNLSDNELRTFIIRKFGDRKIFYRQASVIINEDDITLDNIVDTIFHDEDNDN
jgi:shikimate kinase